MRICALNNITFTRNGINNYLKNTSIYTNIYLWIPSENKYFGDVFNSNPTKIIGVKNIIISDNLTIIDTLNNVYLCEVHCFPNYNLICPFVIISIITIHYILRK